MPGSPEIYNEMAKIMFDASADDRGTVQALARELDEVNEDGKHAIMPNTILR